MKKLRLNRPSYAQPRFSFRFKLPRLHLPHPKAIYPAWLVIIGVCLLLLATVTTPQLKMRQIICTLNQTETCDSQLLIDLAQYHQTTFLFVPIAQIEQKVRAALPHLTQVTIQVTNPQTLSLELHTAKPIAYILAQSGQPLLIYSNFSLNQLGNQQLPATQIEYPGFTVGPESRVDHDLTMKFVVNLLALLQASEAAPETISVNMPQEIILLYPDNQRIIVSSTQPISRQLTTLQLFLSKATMWQGLPVLDVRFEKPVLMAE